MRVASLIVSREPSTEGPCPGVGWPSLPRCATCGERIGVYEPAVWMIGQLAHATSQAASPELTAAHDTAFHADCYIGP